MIHYKIIYSRRRSIGIIITPDSEVIVRAPFRTPLRIIESLVESRSTWIRRHLEKNADRIRINENMEYTDGEYHFFGGRQYPLRIIQSDKSYVKLNDAIELGLKDKHDRVKAGIILEKWYKKSARDILEKNFREILDKNKIYDFSPTGFVVRSMKGRWGSCSSGGRITISSELIKIDEKYSEYVIIHELCHLKHHNHSSAYYQLLSDIYPEWKSIRTGLRRYVRSTSHPEPGCSSSTRT